MEHFYFTILSNLEHGAMKEWNDTFTRTNTLYFVFGFQFIYNSKVLFSNGWCFWQNIPIWNCLIGIIYQLASDMKNLISELYDKIHTTRITLKVSREDLR